VNQIGSSYSRRLFVPLAECRALQSSQEDAARKIIPRGAWQVRSDGSARRTWIRCVTRASCAVAGRSGCACAAARDSGARLTGSPSSSGSSRCTCSRRPARITGAARARTACACAGWRASSRSARASGSTATRATALGEGTRRDSENESNAHRQNASTFDHFVGFLRFVPCEG
jgi:hypothetical protein